MLECQAAGSAEYQVCAAPTSGSSACAQSVYERSSRRRTAASARSAPRVDVQAGVCGADGLTPPVRRAENPCTGHASRVRILSAVSALGRASWLESRFGGEMRLTNERRIVAVRRQGASKTRLPHLGSRSTPLSHTPWRAAAVPSGSRRATAGTPGWASRRRQSAFPVLPAHRYGVS